MRALPLVVLAFFSACTNVFLQPDRMLRYLPDRKEGAWEDVQFRSADGTKLLGLWFRSKKGPPKAVIVHFHGNAENMSSHYLFVYWLAAEGYDVFTFDYRGYGGSQGKRSLKGAIEDGEAALRFAREKAGSNKDRLVVVGQSLGGAIALAALDKEGGEGVRGVILDSTFASYKATARAALSRSWITWLLQPLAYVIVSDRFAPERLIARRKPVPLLMLHAKGDPVVPYAQGRRLFELAPGPKELLTLDSRGHTEAFYAQASKYRPLALAWLDRVLAAK